MKYILYLAAVFTLVSGQLFLKKGVLELPPQASVASVLKTILNHNVLLGYFFYGVSSIIGLFLLKKFPISVIFPAMSVTYVFVVVASSYLFDEKITAFKIIGMVLIMSGVTFLFRD